MRLKLSCKCKLKTVTCPLLSRVLEHYNSRPEFGHKDLRIETPHYARVASVLRRFAVENALYLSQAIYDNKPT